jgi:hypothetical protein
LGHQDNKLLLKNVDLDFGVSKLIDTSGILIDDSTDRVSLLAEEIFEGLDQYKIRSWSDIIVSLFSSLVFLRQFGGLLLHVYAKSNDTVLFWQIFDLFDEVLGHTVQSFLRPGEEPIDGAAIDQRGEHS